MLRVALERAAGNALAPTEFAARLTEATTELATLRVRNATLEGERRAGQPAARDAAADVAALQGRLAAAAQAHSELQAENTRLRNELHRTRSENAGLAEQLQSTTTQHQQAQAIIAQLNAQLMAQKTALAERGGRENVTFTSEVAPAREPARPSVPTALHSAKEPPAGASVTAELRFNAGTLPSADVARNAGIAPAGATEKPKRTHAVQSGDTLEKLAQRYLGAPDRWPAIYEANSSLLGAGQPLRAGMELAIPEN